MNRFRASIFQYLLVTIKDETRRCFFMVDATPEQKSQQQNELARFLHVAEIRLGDIGLRFSQKLVRRMRELVKPPSMDFNIIAMQFDELLDRIYDEVDDKLLFDIPANKIDFYEKPREIFGPSIIDKFPSTALEVEEAGKCYAVARHTACAFHLMRIIEVGVRALGKSLDPMFDHARNPTWETILRKCDDELKKPLKERSAVWKVDEIFFSEATANLRSVKDAWRNPTMHVEHIYDEERALDVFNSVRAFMRHLATKLSESKPDV
jgi:hypothetical protein